MRDRFWNLAFTPAVQAEQERRGSRASYATRTRGDEQPDGPDTGNGLSPREASFIAARDSFYLASVSQTGWPYVQHRGGPAGFVRRIDDHTIGWAEFAGNRQYISIGNTAADDRVSLFFMDYPNQRRLKVLGRLRSYDAGERPDLALRLSVEGYRARVEGVVLVTIEAFDWNCPQHITPRFTVAEIEAHMAPMLARIAHLEARLAEQAGAPSPPPTR